jgi:transposase-like protein
MPNINEADRVRPPRSATPRVNCPHCDAPAVSRSSKRFTPLLRDIYYQCTNVFCGHAFVATLEVTRTVTPSAIPRAGVRLPMMTRGSNHRLIHPPEPQPPANDDAAIQQPNTG